MFTITHASVFLDMTDTQQKQTMSVSECGWCGLVAYPKWGERWTCTVCKPRDFTHSYTIGRDVGRVYQQIRRLTRKRYGTVTFKRSSYSYKVPGEDYTTHVSFALHGTGRQDPGKAWNNYANGPIHLAAFRRLRHPGTSNSRGGDPTLIARHLRLIRDGYYCSKFIL